MPGHKDQDGRTGPSPSRHAPCGSGTAQLSREHVCEVGKAHGRRSARKHHDCLQCSAGSCGQQQPIAGAHVHLQRPGHAIGPLGRLRTLS